jgi:hypothetical protein
VEVTTSPFWLTAAQKPAVGHEIAASPPPLPIGAGFDHFRAGATGGAVAVYVWPAVTVSL